MKTRVTKETKEQELIKKTKDAIEKKYHKTTEQLYEEREKRFRDVIRLKIPDKVPVLFRFGDFPLHYTGLSPYATFYEPEMVKEAILKTLVDFQTDILQGQSPRYSGRALEQVGPVQFLWPGGTLRRDQYSQHLDMEGMKEDEYDLFIADPSDFTVRRYLPRVWKALEPLSKLPALQSFIGTQSVVVQSPRLITPELIQAFEAIYRAGQEQKNFTKAWQDKDIGEIVGIAPFTDHHAGVAPSPPFDVIVNHLRGMRGTAIDMFRRPEKLIAACNKLMEYQLLKAVPPPPGEKGTKRVHVGHHYQSEEMLSRKQFEKFCWPTGKKMILTSIELGYVPGIHLEGKNDDRIECFLDLPKGKAFMRFEKIDIFRAKEMLGGHICIVGGVPSALLWQGSTQEVDEYCRNLIKTVGKGGGYVLACDCPDESKPANVRAMIDAVEKYGWY